MKTGRFLVPLITALLASASAHAAILQRDVVVEGNTLHLGDVFADLPTALGSRVIMAAPNPGRTLVLDARALTTLSQRNGLGWQPATLDDRATITRASQRFDNASLTDAVLQQARNQNFPEPVNGRLSARLDNADLALHAPLDASAELRVSALNINPTTQRFNGTVSLMVGGQVYTQAAIGGRMVTTITIPTLTRTLQKGDVIAATDIDWQEIEQTTATTAIVSAAENLIGKTPRQALRANQPIRAIDLLTPSIIARGSTITLLYRNGGLQLTTQGRALQDGGKGDPIRVINLASNRLVEGRVSAAGVVEVGPAPLPNLTTTAALASPPLAITTN